MAVAFVRNHTVTSEKVLDTSVNLQISTATTIDDVLVVNILFDNAGTTLKPIVSSIAKAAGETNNWVFLGAARSPGTSIGAASAGEMWAIKTTVVWPVATYAVTLDTSVTQKATIVSEYSGVLATIRSTVGGVYQTSTPAASASTSGTTPVIGDLAVGFIFGSNVAAAQAGDNDTTGGSWSSPVGVGSTGAGAATNNYGIVQYKILTTASHQTYNNQAAMTAGNGSIVAILQAAPVVNPKTETLTDTFDTDINTVKWPTGNRYGTVAWSSGQAAITERSAAYSGIASVYNAYDLSNSYVFVKATPPSIQTTSTETTLSVYGPTSANGLFFIIFYDGTNQTCLRQTVNTVTNNSFVAYDAVQMAYIRIRKDNTNAYWDTSPDGTTWTNRRTLASTLNLSQVTVELSVGQWSAESAQRTGYFDNVNIAAPVGGKPKVWTGSAWVEKPVKYWTGSAWVEKPMKFWNGSSWELV